MESCYLKQSVLDMFTASPARKYGFSFYTYPDYYHNHGVLAGWNTFNNFNWDKKHSSYCSLTFKMV